LKQITTRDRNSGTEFVFDIEALLDDDITAKQMLISQQSYLCERCHFSIRIEHGRMFDDNTNEPHDCIKSIKKKVQKKPKDFEQDRFYRNVELNKAEHNPIYHVNMRCNCYNCKMLRQIRGYQRSHF